MAQTHAKHKNEGSYISVVVVDGVLAWVDAAGAPCVATTKLPILDAWLLPRLVINQLLFALFLSGATAGAVLAHYFPLLFEIFFC